MKKNVLMTVVGIGVAIVLAGCGESAVKCDDSDAQKLVMEIVEEETKNQLTGDTRLTYAALVQAGSIEWTDKIDKQYADANGQLTNIRVENMDDKLMKSECAAQLSYANGNTLDITYQLSKTTEGSLFAEVSGL